MLDVLVKSHPAAEMEIQRCPKKWDVVVVSNSYVPLSFAFSKFSTSFLQVIFDDIDCYFSSFVMPDKNDVKRTLEFCKDKKKVLFTCNSGFTRSASLAYVVECQYSNPKQVIKKYRSSVYHLNRLIVKYGAELLNSEEIYKQYEIHHPKAMFSYQETVY